MLSVIHLVVGVVIGTFVGNWPVAFLLAIGSHFVLDALPHTDSGTLKEPEERGDMNLTDFVLAWADLVVALFVLLALVRTWTFSASIFAGAIGGITPDFAHGAYYALPILKTTAPFSWYYQFHRRIQRTTTKKDWLVGMIVQIVIFVIALTLILYKAPTR